MKLWGRVCLIALVNCAWVQAAAAREIFVAPSGTGTGTSAAPFGRIQDALNAAQPGDVITIAPGTYSGALTTVRSGLAGSPIRVRASGARGSAVVTTSGRVLAVNHAYHTVEGLVFDGQYGDGDVIRVYTAGHYLQLRNVEVRRSTRDLIDISDAQGVLIEDSLLHRALNAANGRTDAHGIAAGAVRDLTIRNTKIHTFSGDGVQVDPGRSSPGWSRVTIEGSRIWLAPLPAPENGFPAGARPGENAVDTKASSSYPRATIVIRDTVAWGFRDSALMTNAAAFNLKENIEATLDRVTVHDSQIAFRTRGATSSSPNGAWVTVTNTVVHNVNVAFRYENDIERLRIYNTTLGRNVGRPFQAASSNDAGLDVQNLLVLGAVPSAVAAGSNIGVDSSAFLNAAGDDYHLMATATAIDTGVTVPGVTTDRDGLARPQGAAFDIGAYERPATVTTPEPSPEPTPPPPSPAEAREVVRHAWAVLVGLNSCGANFCWEYEASQDEVARTTDGGVPGQTTPLTAPHLHGRRNRRLLHRLRFCGFCLRCGRRN